MARLLGREDVPVPVSVDLSSLDRDWRTALGVLSDAADLMNPVFLSQMRNNPRAEALDASRGNYFYPPNISQKLLEDHLAAYPQKRAELLGHYNAVRLVWMGSNDEFGAISYSALHPRELDKAADFLELATRLTSSDPAFSEFLRLRAQAFRSGRDEDYRASDVAWVCSASAPIELTIGPYEEYEDGWFGTKRSFEAVLGVVVKDETSMLSRYQGYATAYDRYLGNRFGYSPVVIAAPMLVIDQVRAGGRSLYRFVPQAFNLPNDPDVHAQVGSKKVFIRNVIEAKFQHISLPIAVRTLSESIDFSRDFSSAHYFFLVGHELSHGLGFRFDGETFGELASPFEEAKADVFGLGFLFWLAEHAGELPRSHAATAMVFHVADMLRQLRFGFDEAHALGALIQYNWLLSQRALHIDKEGRFAYHIRDLRASFDHLAVQLFELSRSNNPDELRAFKDIWGKPDPDLERTLSRIEDVPVDINPIFSAI